LLLITSIFIGGALIIENATLNMNPVNGIFGWLNADVILTVLIFQGLLSTFFGMVGYIIAMQYYDPLICSTCQLFEPYLA